MCSNMCGTESGAMWVKSFLDDDDLLDSFSQDSNKVSHLKYISICTELFS